MLAVVERRQATERLVPSAIDIDHLSCSTLEMEVTLSDFALKVQLFLARRWLDAVQPLKCYQPLGASPSGVGRQAASETWRTSARS